MSIDNKIKLASYILYWAVFSLLFLFSDNKKVVAGINISLHVIYSIYFLFHLNPTPGDWMGIWNFLGLIGALWLHLSVNFVQLIRILLIKLF